MRQQFQDLLTDLEPKFLELRAMAPVKPCALPRQMPTAGIYVFSHGDDHRYVGRTNRLRGRLQEHCRPSSSHDSAPFAFKLARIRTGSIVPSYTKHGSRKWLSAQPEFAAAFTSAKAEIRDYDVRWVEELRPTQQLLLEVYVALALGIANHDFDNH